MAFLSPPTTRPAGRAAPPHRLLLAMAPHQLADKATESGLRVWTAWDPDSPEADLLERVADASEELMLTDFTNAAELRRLVDRAVERHRVDTVLPCAGGPAVLPLVDAAWRRGVSPNPPAAHARLGAWATAPADVPRVSVQTLTVASAHHVVGVTAHRTSGPPDYAVTGHLHPAPLRVREWEAVERAVLRRLRRSRYRFGPAHTELALTRAGPRVLSCRPRFSPGRIPLLAEVASGFDWERATLAALRGEPPRVPPPSRYAELAFFPLPEGRLRTFTGLENIAVTPWVRGVRFPYAAGEWTPPPTHPRARRAYVVVAGDSPEQTRERVRQARADLVTHIETEE